jgi:hypothetical protein
MLGKVKLDLVPPLPQWLHTPLLLDPRGFTTGPMPYGPRTVSMGIDVFAGLVWVSDSDGRQAQVPLGPERSVAAIWGDVRAALAGLGVEPHVWEKPQETADTTLFSQNSHDHTFVPEHAQRFHRVLSSVNGVFEEFRSRFFGRSGVQFWWGDFDLGVLLFNGRRAQAPEGLGYILRHDLDAEQLSAGFWVGDDADPTPRFYGYVAPRPPRCETAPIAPGYAGWAEAAGEWLMPYEQVRTSDDPPRALLDFLGAVYRVATSLGGWDASDHEYDRPAGRRRD